MDLNDDGSVPPVEITETRDGTGRHTITIVGEMDLSSVAGARPVIEDVLQRGPTGIDFDLSGVSFMDSSGIAIIIEAARLAPDIRVVNPSRQVRRLIQLSGLTATLPVQP